MATNKQAVLDLLGLGSNPTPLQVAAWEPTSGYNRGLIMPDGTTRIFGLELGGSAMPMVLPPGDGAAAGLQWNGTDGTFAIIGAVPLLATVTAGVGAYLYFPANQIAGITHNAGWYYAEISSTTAGKVYNNTYSIGTPSAPTTLVPFTGVTNAAFITQVTTEVTAHSILVPGNWMGPSGRILIENGIEYNNSVGTKSVRTKFNGTTIYVGTGTTSAAQRWMPSIQNAGATNKQRYLSSGVAPAAGPGAGVTGTGYQSLASDTTTDFFITNTLTLTTANTDTVGMAFMYVHLFPGA